MISHWCLLLLPTQHTSILQIDDGFSYFLGPTILQVNCEFCPTSYHRACLGDMHSEQMVKQNIFNCNNCRWVPVLPLILPLLTSARLFVHILLFPVDRAFNRGTHKWCGSRCTDVGGGLVKSFTVATLPWTFTVSSTLTGSLSSTSLGQTSMAGFIGVKLSPLNVPLARYWPLMFIMLPFHWIRLSIEVRPLCAEFMVQWFDFVPKLLL